MNLTGEPPRSRKSGTLRSHTWFKSPTEGRHNCAMEVNGQFLNLENGEELSLVVGESGNSDDSVIEDVTNVDPKVEKESVTDELYEITDDFVPGKKHEGAEEFPSARDERVWKEGKPEFCRKVFRTPFESGDSVWAFSPQKKSGKQHE